MKRIWILRPFVWLLASLLALQFGTVAYAHPTSQEGILAKTYIDKLLGEYYGDYFIGGDDVGWRIMEQMHTNGTTLTYSFSTIDENLTPALKSYTRTGASRWSGTVTITEKTDGSGRGEIYTYRKTDVNAVANFVVPDEDTIDAYGHTSSWKIWINLKYEDSVGASTMAHEFGHAIGLTDLYGAQSRNKLMYGTSARTTNYPTELDKWGAKVITGVHTTHTWGYKYYGASSTGGNSHIKYCTQCNGLTNSVYNCTYNSQNVCTACGIPYGANISSIGQETQQVSS